MNRLQEQSARFEILVGKVLIAAGYEVEREVRADVGGQMFAIDLVFRSADGCRYLAEVKWTRLDPVPLQMLRDWAARLRAYKASFPEAQLVLIVSGAVKAAHRDWVEQQFGIDVWDAERLDLFARDDANLSAQLHEFEEETKKLEAERLKVRGGAVPPADLEREEKPPLQTPGAELIARLKAIPPGKTGAKAYERACTEIIDYLFGEHLVDACPQSRTEDGLNVFNVVYRVRQSHSFGIH